MPRTSTRRLLAATWVATCVAGAPLSTTRAQPAADAGVQRMDCSVIGADSTEAIGDRPDHQLVVSRFACRAVEGPLAGAVATGTHVYEVDGANARLLASEGTMRGGDGWLVFQQTEGSKALTLNGGRLLGFSMAGRGAFRAAFGSRAAWQGRGYSYIGHATGPGTFAMDLRLE